jgi:predicted Holliday junction resolvase-like endonuclease
MSEKEKKQEKEQTPLLSENPVIIEQKQKMSEYMNKHSRLIFIIMLVLIGISVGISVYTSLTRKRVEFKPREVKTKIENSTGQEIGKFNKLVDEYNSLKSKEKRVDSLIEKIEKKKSETYNMEE